MAALSVQVPYPVFYDRDGDPLDNGNIYIGIANLDPVTNPLQVYYDEALTIPASQPLKTSNGYIYRNGTPAQLYVNAVNFSILVNDAKNTLVYSFPDGTGLGVGAASITYNEGSSGAVTRTVESRLQDYVSVKDFGAVGDGVADDTPKIQAAINSGSKRIYFPPGNYKVTGPIDCVSNQTLYGDATITLYESSNPFFFDVSGCTFVTFDGLSFDGRRSSWVYPPTISGNRAIDTRSRYSAIFGEGIFSNITVKNCSFTEMYSSAIYLYGSTFNEKSITRNILVENCVHKSSNLELVNYVYCGDAKMMQCSISNISNPWGNIALLANGAIWTACDGSFSDNNYIANTGAAAVKMQANNGETYFTNNTCIDNGTLGVALQQSAAEQIPTFSGFNEKTVISGNCFIRQAAWAIQAESATIHGQKNCIVSNNQIIGAGLGGISLSNDNWIIANNSFVGPPVSGTSAYAIFVNAYNGKAIKNIVIADNLFDLQNVTAKPDILFGLAPAQDMSVTNVSITGNLFRNVKFRGIAVQNDVFCDEFFVANNQFYMETLDGLATSDIYISNNTHALKWTVCNNTVAQRIAVNLTNAGSYAAVYNNKVTATESRDTTDQYSVFVNGNLASLYDLGTRLVCRAAAPPASGEYAVGDLVWNTAPATAGYIGWVCTVAGSPGTWKGFGVIA